MMNGPEKSDPVIVAGKLTNKAERSAAELVEPNLIHVAEEFAEPAPRFLVQVSAGRRSVAIGFGKRIQAPLSIPSRVPQPSSTKVVPPELRWDGVDLGNIPRNR
jgi:hypothetical protein